MRSFVRLSLIGLVALVAIGFAVTQQQSDGDKDKPQVKVSTGMCSEVGTSLVVDFGTNQKGPLIEKCVEDFSGYSWDLFEVADIEVAGTEKYPVGFVCRIENFPNEASEPCKDTPGIKNGSWAYFLTDETGAWKYSPIGASTHKAKCGVSEGWRFLLHGEPTNAFPRATPKAYVCTN
jgi:hypothetical protein